MLAMSTIFKFIASHNLKAISRPFFGQWILFNAWHHFPNQFFFYPIIFVHTLLPLVPSFLPSFPVIPVLTFFPFLLASRAILGNRNLEVRLIAGSRVATKWRYEEKTQGCRKKRRGAQKCTRSSIDRCPPFPPHSYISYSYPLSRPFQPFPTDNSTVENWSKVRSSPIHFLSIFSPLPFSFVSPSFSPSAHLFQLYFTYLRRVASRRKKRKKNKMTIVETKS